MKKLSKGFFEKTRPLASEAKNNSQEKVIPVKWSKEVLEGKKKVTLTLLKK